MNPAPTPPLGTPIQRSSATCSGFRLLLWMDGLGATGGLLAKFWMQSTHNLPAERLVYEQQARAEEEQMMEDGETPAPESSSGEWHITLSKLCLVLHVTRPTSLSLHSHTGTV